MEGVRIVIDGSYVEAYQSVKPQRMRGPLKKYTNEELLKSKWE